MYFLAHLGTRQERLNVVLVTGCISKLATLRLRLLEDEDIFGRLHVAAERCGNTVWFNRTGPS